MKLNLAGTFCLTTPDGPVVINRDRTVDFVQTIAARLDKQHADNERASNAARVMMQDIYSGWDIVTPMQATVPVLKGEM